MKLLVQAGAEVHAAWTTSGDKFVKREIRESELQRSMDILGLDESRTHLLRIPDLGTVAMLEEAAETVTSLVEVIRPDIIFANAYEGGHPDHDSAAFAVQIACEMLAGSGRKAPARVEFTSYHAHAGGMRTGDFLPATSPVTEMRLTPYECDLKRRMFECFRSRRRVLAQGREQIVDRL